jgi:hypothetical protein
MSIYKPCIDKKKAVEEIVKDLSPGIRELAKDVIEIRSRYNLKFKGSRQLFRSLRESSI